MKLVECVPNVSEGRDRGVIDALAATISRVAGVKLLDVDPGADTNRTVFTFVGEPAAVSEAAFNLARRSADLIDMSRHKGEHPRIGALDVCPIVPISGVTMEECADVARALGRRIGDALQVPVYFYEHAASSEERRSLANIREGEYEGLPDKLADPRWRPDAGPTIFNPRLGACVVGAREFLIAFNVNLNTRDKRLASEIALNIREAGRVKRDGSGHPMTDAAGGVLRVPGRLKAIRAIGWYIEEYRQAQVSINMMNYKETPLHRVFETVREEADRLGMIVTGSELVGMTPLAPILDAGRFYLRKQGKSSGAPEHELVDMAVRSLGLDQLGPFEPDKKIIEYAVNAPKPLLSLTVERFVDEVSSESPAPGGGSVAAVAGSLGAALAAMVANLTVGKKGYESVWTEMNELAERAQRVKGALAAAVDEDTRAFTRVMDAMRLPKATMDQQRAREAAIAEASREAARVPLETARLCVQALELARHAAQHGHRLSASDAGVAALVARAGVEGAGLNVLTNLGSVQDQPFCAAARDEVGRLIAEADRLCADVIARVRDRISGSV